MTDTPVLTPKQARKALSAKKVKKKSIKPTLITPFNTQSRPIVTTEDCKQINHLLTKLPRLLAEKTPISWSAIKEIPKDQRKAFREDKQEHKLPNNKEMKQGLILGINSVTEAIEKRNLDAVLVSHDINPFHMVEHFFDSSIISTIPVLIVQNLRQTLYDTLGIASTCLGISVKKQSVPLLACLIDVIKAINVNYNPPIGDSLSCLADKNVSLVSAISSDESPDLTCLEREKQICTMIGSTSSASKNVLLHRTDGQSRVFVPTKKQTDSDQLKADYIQFNSSAPLLSKQHIDIQVARIIANKRNNKKTARRIRILEKTGYKIQPNKFKKYHK